MYHPKYKELEKLANQPTLSSLMKDQTIATGKSLDNYSKQHEVGYLRVGNIKPYKPLYSKLAHTDMETVSENNLQILQENDVLISRVGTVGMVSLFYGNPLPCTFSDNVLKATPEKINPRYLVVFLNSKFGLLQIERIIKGSLQGVINTTTLGAIHVFVPLNPNVAEKIGNEVFSAYESSKKLENEAMELEKSMDAFVLKKLAFQLPTLTNVLAYVTADKVMSGQDRLDPKFYHPDHITLQKEIYDKSRTKLDDLCTFPTRPIGTVDPERSFLYVDIASINRTFGTINRVKKLLFKNAPQRANQIIHENDVIVSLTRPTRNAIALVPHELEGQVCSSGFAILVAKPCVEPMFLLTLLRTEVVRLQMSYRTRGAMYPAILPSDLKKLAMPYSITDIEKQRCVVQEVKTLIDSIQEKREMSRKILNDAQQKVERELAKLIEN
jgi:type I restriction enzyme S subunit